MTLWYVNPKNPANAVDLLAMAAIDRLGSIVYFTLKNGKMIHWQFKDDNDAVLIFEGIIKILQEFRTRKAF